MLNSEGFNESLLSIVEDFSLLPAQTPVHFNKDDILDNKMLCVFRIISYKSESRSTTSGADGDREPQGNHREASEW